MATTAITLRLQLLSSPSLTQFPYACINSHAPTTTVLSGRYRSYNSLLRLEKGQHSVQKARAWGANSRSGMLKGDYGDDIDDEEDEDDDEEEEEEDRSLDLLIRFVENVFRKVSRKARKAVKSVLPVPISTRLFTVGNERELLRGAEEECSFTFGDYNCSSLNLKE